MEFSALEFQAATYNPEDFRHLVKKPQGDGALLQLSSKWILGLDMIFSKCPQGEKKYQG